MDSESYRAAVEWGLPKSFTPFHGCLLDFLRNPRARPGIPSLENEGKILTSKDLDSLRIMVEIEFEASCQQELSGSETADTKPHVFDVFLMQTTFDQSSIRGSERKIAVCVPFQKQVQWWNGLPRNAGGAFWPLEPKSHIRKITSLSGTARVLQALSEAQSSPSDLTRWAMNRTSLFSVPTIDVDGEIIRSSTMNESQQRAVDAMSHFQSGFFCIQGPPGCGKTTTMVQMILAAKKQGGVLVAAPSNAAVANIALKLYATGLISFGEAVVFGTNCDESVHFLEPSYRSSQYTKFRNNYDVALSSPEGFEPTEKQKQKAQQLLEEFALWLHLDKDDLSLSNASSHCPNIPVDETGSVTFLGRKIMNQLLGDASVIFCTLNSVGSFSLSSALDRKNFKTLMIDEGGQCTEAEFFLATSFPGIQRILVMGDPKQLRPTVIDLDCARAGYGQSFLGQVFKGSPEKLHLLDTQYRMDPAIVAFPNRRFYNNQIQNGENVLQREPHVNKPFLFVDTNRYGREEKIQHSWQNQYEASAIAVLLRRDEDINRLLATSDETKVIIITPYKSQMRLLENQIKLPKGSKAQLMTSTVDAFQGQEGDIVIVSTVRTKFVGFVDDAQRLNVALTRAKRVLRVVGDKRFFESLGDHSTLRQLVEHAWNAGQWIVSPVKRVRFSPPDWSMPTLWKITMTQRFHHCLFHMKNMPSKNICLNTLFAIAIPDLRAIRGKKVAENSGWKINSLNGAEDLRVVWIAKKDVAEGRPIIEAHFAGDRQSCLRFIQTNHRSQAGSLIPKSDMSGLLPTKLDATAIADGTPMPSWKLDNDTQQAILSGTLSEMPFSFLELDPPQKLAARAPPPLLIESRSGTGKTLVLLQHAALTTRMDQSRPACFVTVSPKLKEELNKKYLELRPILFDGLRPTEFFSFRELLYSLLHLTGIDAFCDKSICTFDGYIGEKNSYQRCTIEPQEVENEIGGVIMGSLAAAIGNAALNRQEYLSNKRSNISNKSKEGVQKRHLVYDEYEKYTRWKVATSRYDLNDVILCLLNKKIDQLFSSGT